MIHFIISLICFYVSLFGIFYGAFLVLASRERNTLMKHYYEQEAKDIIEELKLDMSTPKLTRIIQICSALFGSLFLISGAWLFCVSVVSLGS